MSGKITVIGICQGIQLLLQPLWRLSLQIHRKLRIIRLHSLKHLVSHHDDIISSVMTILCERLCLNSRKGQLCFFICRC